MMRQDETLVWRGSPSHVSQLGTYVLCVLFCWLIVPIFIAIWKWIVLRTRRYELTNQRLFYSWGVFSKHHEELEVYRIKDFRVEEPFLYRIFGKGNVILQTSDRSTPDFVMEAVARPRDLADKIRQQVEQRRDEKRVRELDMDVDVQ